MSHGIDKSRDRSGALFVAVAPVTNQKPFTLPFRQQSSRPLCLCWVLDRHSILSMILLPVVLSFTTRAEAHVMDENALIVPKRLFVGAISQPLKKRAQIETSCSALRLSRFPCHRQASSKHTSRFETSPSRLPIRSADFVVATKRHDNTVTSSIVAFSTHDDKYVPESRRSQHATLRTSPQFSSAAATHTPNYYLRSGHSDIRRSMGAVSCPRSWKNCVSPIHEFPRAMLTRFTPVIIVINPYADLSRLS
jgi:hypothetical protein